MRSLRNISFVLLCLCWLQVRVHADACYAPGLFGTGSTEQAAEDACGEYGEGHCSGMCQQACGTDAWDGSECTGIQGGGGWTASGRCKCVPDI